MTRTIVRTDLGGNATVATVLTESGWLIALSERLVENSVEEHFAIATAERAIGLYMMGFRQPEGGVDCMDMLPRVPGPRVLPPIPAPRMEPDAPVNHRIAAAVVAPLTALAATVAAFSEMFGPALGT